MHGFTRVLVKKHTRRKRIARVTQTRHGNAGSNRALIHGQLKELLRKNIGRKKNAKKVWWLALTTSPRSGIQKRKSVMLSQQKNLPVLAG